MRTYEIKVDGYNFGDRLLEGVKFDVTVEVQDKDNMTVTSVRTGRADVDYMADLNEAKWLTTCKDYVEDSLPSLLWEEITDEEWAEAVDLFHPTYEDGTPMPKGD